MKRSTCSRTTGSLPIVSSDCLKRPVMYGICCATRPQLKRLRRLMYESCPPNVSNSPLHLHDGAERAVAEHVAQHERHASANECPEAIGAGHDVRLPDVIELQLVVVLFRRKLGGRRQADGGILEQTNDLAARTRRGQHARYERLGLRRRAGWPHHDEPGLRDAEPRGRSRVCRLEARGGGAGVATRGVTAVIFSPSSIV